jgi:two-component system response regulator YesN
MQVKLMYKVMLVDDDYPVIEFLEKAIPWHELGFTVIASEDDSRNALAKVDKEMPDLLITDIGMPYLNGMELLQQLLAKNHALTSVILSCHDEFHYAQKAIKLGVHEYILKETMDPEQIIVLLQGIRKKMDEERADTNRQANLSQLVQVSQGAYREYFIKQLLDGPIMDPEPWNRQLHVFGIDVGNITYIPAVCYIHQFEQQLTRYHSEEIVLFALENLLNEMLADHSLPAVFRMQRRLILLIPYQPSCKGMDEPSMLSLMQHICRNVAKYLKLELSFLVESSCGSVQELKSKTQLLLQQVRHLFYAEPTTLVRNQSLDRSFTDADIFIHYQSFLDQFRHYIMEESADEIDQAVRDWSAKLHQAYYHPEEVKAFYHKLVQDLQVKLKTIDQFGQNYSNERLHQSLNRIDSMSDLIACVTEIVQGAIKRMNQISRSSKRREIVNAQKYIAIHLHRKITLEEVAMMLHLNPSYFSRLYKQETEEGFNEYVTRLRMEKAMELFDLTNKTVEEIAGELGYENKSYFNKLFKKFTGFPPMEYKQNSRE